MALASAAPVTAETICAAAPFEDDTAPGRLHAAVADAVSAFPDLLATLEGGLSLCLSDTLRDARGYFEPELDRIVLAADLPPGLALAVAVHELRHVQQDSTGSCPSLDLSMRDYAEAVFAMEADASVTSLVVAANLREAGDPQMWEALAAWPMQADLAATFDAVLQAEGDVAAAAAAVFEAWYRNEARRDAYYVASCLDYLDQTEREDRLPRYESLSEGFFLALCRLPDGSRYPCARPEQP